MGPRKRIVKKSEDLPVNTVHTKDVKSMFAILLTLQILIGISSTYEYILNKHANEALTSAICNSRERRRIVDDTYYYSLAASLKNNPKVHKIIEARAYAVATLIKESSLRCGNS